jgi:integrase
MLRVEAPKRQASEDLDVVSVTGGDVRRMFDVCETWGELLCISTLAYLGPRRGAVAKLRWRDIDLARGRIRFKEKGGKTIYKPIPDEFAQLLRAAVVTGEVESAPTDYVIAMQRKRATVATGTTALSRASSRSSALAQASRSRPTRCGRRSRCSSWRPTPAS